MSKLSSLIPPLRSASTWIPLWVTSLIKVQLWLLTKDKSRRWTTVWESRRLPRNTMSCFSRNSGERPRWICVRRTFLSHPLLLKLIMKLKKIRKSSPISWWIPQTCQWVARETRIGKMVGKRIPQAIYSIYWWHRLLSRSIGWCIGFSTSIVLRLKLYK